MFDFREQLVEISQVPFNLSAPDAHGWPPAPVHIWAVPIGGLRSLALLTIRVNLRGAFLA
jgi:hypothetical protein